MDNQFPFSERYRLAREERDDKVYAAKVLEETKSLVFAQRCAALGDIPVNRAEQIVKASSDWMDYVKSIVESRYIADKSETKVKVAEMRYWESQSKEASARAEMKL